MGDEGARKEVVMKDSLDQVLAVMVAMFAAGLDVYIWLQGAHQAVVALVGVLAFIFAVSGTKK